MLEIDRTQQPGHTDPMQAPVPQEPVPSNSMQASVLQEPVQSAPLQAPVFREPMQLTLPFVEPGTPLLAQPEALPTTEQSDPTAQPTESQQKFSTLAVVSGYLGIIPLLWSFYLLPLALSPFPPGMGMKQIGILTGVTIVVCIYPGLLTGILGHTRIYRDRTLGGMGHIRFAYVSSAIAFTVLAAAWILHFVRK